MLLYTMIWVVQAAFCGYIGHTFLWLWTDPWSENVTCSEQLGVKQHSSVFPCMFPSAPTLYKSVKMTCTCLTRGYLKSSSRFNNDLDNEPDVK